MGSGCLGHRAACCGSIKAGLATCSAVLGGRRQVERAVVKLEGQRPHEGVPREEDEPRVLLLHSAPHVGERGGGLDGDLEGG